MNINPMLLAVVFGIVAFTLLGAKGHVNSDFLCPMDTTHECEFLAKQRLFHAEYGMNKQSDGVNRKQSRDNIARELGGTVSTVPCYGASLWLRNQPLQCPLFLPNSTKFDNIVLTVNGEFFTVKALRDVSWALFSFTVNKKPALCVDIARGGNFLKN